MKQCLMKEQVKKNKFQVRLVDKNIMHWMGVITGPEKSVYEGGQFRIDIKIPPEYPYKAPKMQFVTKVWHPNISSQTGAICLDILKDEWTPALTIRTTLISVGALLCSPEPDNPQDAVVAQMYKSNKPEFDKTAKEWTQKYAIQEKNEEVKINKLVEMGFDREQCIQALKDNAWDEKDALQSILNN